MDNKELSFTMAERIKKLRENAGLSHEKLSRELYSKYRDSNDSKREEQRRKRKKDKESESLISKSSLMDYECTDEYHAKAYKNEGMSVGYLRYLADFYGVSADYILGLSDVPTRDQNLKNICESTGLSQRAAEKLIKWRNNRNAYGELAMDFISEMILDHQFIFEALRAGCALGDLRDSRVKTMSEEEIKSVDEGYLFVDYEAAEKFYIYTIQKSVSDFVLSFFETEEGDLENAEK